MFDFLKDIFQKSSEQNNNKVLSGIIGLCVGDALGVPVEFMTREEISNNPIKNMKGYMGKHNQPPGTWSDDSSMTLCTVESLCRGYDIKDIGNEFCKWYYEGYWTADKGLPFDVGNSTLKALAKIKSGYSETGDSSERGNGNGSLMRILPMAYYLENYQGDRFQLIEEVSGITHAHIRSKIACSIYIEIAINLLKGLNPMEAYEKMKPVIINYYTEKEHFDELVYFKRILKNDITTLNITDIESSGYVIDTLESSLWCLLNSSSYAEAVLTAVNLGDDTDTVGAVTGGLAGIYYGFNNIPSKWIKTISRKDEILILLERFNNSILNVSDYEHKTKTVD